MLDGGAGAVDRLRPAAVLGGRLQGREVRGAETAGDIDLAGRQGRPQRCPVAVEEAECHAGVPGVGLAVVVGVQFEDRLVRGEPCQPVGAGAGGGAVGPQGIGGVGLRVDDGSRGGGDLVGEGRVGPAEVEGDRLLVRGLDAVDRGQQRGRTARGVDAQRAVEGVLDGRRGQPPAAREAQVVTERAGEAAADAVGEAALLSGVGPGLGAAGREGEQ